MANPILEFAEESMPTRERKAFQNFLRYGVGLEGAYIDGVSLTHGVAGSRQHIWSFAAALSETYTDSYDFSILNCACTNANSDWPFQVPSFVGNNYFCDTGNRGPGAVTSELYPDDPLWDGEGCGPTSTCCEFNNPPWFCTTLPQPTSDDIEVRNCFIIISQRSRSHHACGYLHYVELTLLLDTNSKYVTLLIMSCTL